MAGTISDGWQIKPSSYNMRRYNETTTTEQAAVPLRPLWVGISILVRDIGNADIAIAIHDGVFSLQDFSVKSVGLGEQSQGDEIANHVLRELKLYERCYLAKFIGAGLPRELKERSPNLPSRLWLELDVVPILINAPRYENDIKARNQSWWHKKSVDEQANSMVRKCILYFGPKLVPVLKVGHSGAVGVDSDFRVNIATLDDYRKTCSSQTWETMKTYASSLKAKNQKIAFFSSTPQGGGVALMRHSLVRFANLLDIDLKWYVPKPKPSIYRITKKMHNILQGVKNPDERVCKEEKKTLNDWIGENAKRYWLSLGGPLLPPSEGGADIIIIDDPQMQPLIPLAKNVTPERPVLFRSHIHIHTDLADQEGTAQADVWEFLWNNVKEADTFISHPIPSFVPKNVPKRKIAYMPAATDWLDGLNKNIDPWDLSYYRDLYNKECDSAMMTRLTAKKYIIQIARFDPSKGIDDVLKSYAEFYRLLEKYNLKTEAPQLVITGHSSIDDPESTKIYDETMSQIETQYPHLVSSISAIRLNANDQLLNSLLSGSHIVLQLSTREGFEVKISEALHKGKPVIATKTGGIPLQLQDRKSGFLVDTGDWKAVAQHMFNLWIDDALYNTMSRYAKNSVSDEVGTVGNAMAWFYLADKWGNGEGVSTDARWVNDLARDAAGQSYKEEENKLPRSV